LDAFWADTRLNESDSGAYDGLLAVKLHTWTGEYGRTNAIGKSLITFGILASGSVIAKHWHEDEKHWKEHGNHKDQDDRGYDHRNHSAKNCYFQPRDARIVTEYYAPRYRALPPGLQKKLYRNGHLPPGWQNKIEPLPIAVEPQLVPVPSGYSRGYINGYAVVYSPRTQVVVDIVAVFGR
jgi:hypothetical protein